MAELETTMATPLTEAAGAQAADAAPQPAGLQLEAKVKSEVSSPSKLRQVRHTRSCNGRDMCSCMLRVESAYFQKNLVEKAAKKRRMDSAAFAVVARARPRKYQRITNIQQFSLEIKHHLAAFLGAVGLARLAMTNKALKCDVEVLAERATSELLANESRLEHLLKERRPRPKESWSRFMHAQMTCVHKLFVYYTGYKTGPMRQQFPHWAFGVVYVDPNMPHRIILPNAWTFHGHNPWVRQRANGKDGEWQLRGTYKSDKAPKDFQLRVKEWASTIRPGSLLAIAYQNAGSLEPKWWEAQAWYIWRGDGKQEPAIVFDPETSTHIRVHPDDLADHFKAHPLHVIDVSSTPGATCRHCSAKGRSFKFCHVDKGHPML